MILVWILVMVAWTDFLGEVPCIVFHETRELLLVFPGAVLLASFVAAVYRQICGGVAGDLGAVFD